MPMTVSQAQAHESPLVRIRARFPDGQLHQMTINSTYRPSPEVARSEGYCTALAEAINQFFGGRGVTVVRIEHLSAVSMEVGL